MTIDTLLCNNGNFYIIFCMYFKDSPHNVLVDVHNNIHFLPGIIIYAYLELILVMWLLYGCYRKRKVYQCGDLEKFIDAVTEKVELLPEEKVAEALKEFQKQ